MRALSIRQPWAALIVDGVKDIENRDWRGIPGYRGWIAIHASKTFDLEGVAAAQRIINNIGSDMEVRLDPEAYQKGGIIGYAYLNDIVSYDSSPWFTGPMGFKLRMPRRCEFVPCKGNLGLWKLDDETNRKVI